MSRVGSYVLKSHRTAAAKESLLRKQNAAQTTGRIFDLIAANMDNPLPMRNTATHLLDAGDFVDGYFFRQQPDVSRGHGAGRRILEHVPNLI
jgi:hypothetical protein